ncbi:MAG: response regulator transcription factor [Flavobacteriaceae bacterium]|nr:response regulator transcription factor [Flavobacteriaceae bacterium]
MGNFKVVIIDDDTTSVILLQKYIQKFSLELCLVYETNIIDDGIKFIKEYSPDIIFIGAIVNGQDAFNFLEMLEETNSLVIIISTNEVFAIKALKSGVFDYILKPFEESQIINTLIRAIDTFNNQNRTPSKGLLLTNQKLKFLAIITAMQTELLPIENIMYFEADGKKTNIYLADSTHRISNKNLGEYERLLGNNILFFRIHHKYVINLNRVLKINLKDNTCKMMSECSLLISKRKKAILYKLLKI